MAAPGSPKKEAISPRLRPSAEPADLDKRFFMGSYGTFGMDTIHGRLFELQVYVDSIKFHTCCYFAFVLIALIFCPIAAFLAIPLGWLPEPEKGRQDKDIAMFRMFLVMATLLALMIWAIPIFIVSLGGGLRYFQRLIYVEKELNFLDFVDFFLSELMILLTIVFAWVYHDININTTKYKIANNDSWKRRKQEYGLQVEFPRTQFDRLLNVLREDSTEHQAYDFDEETKMVSSDRGHMYIEDVVKILESLPGWNGTSDHIEFRDNMLHVTSKKHIDGEGVDGFESGLFAELTALSDEAIQRNIWPIDVWLVRDQYYPKAHMDLDIGIKVAFHNTFDLLKNLKDYFMANHMSLAIVIFLAFIRAMLPRFWLWGVNNGKFWPDDWSGPPGRLVLYSTTVTFSVSVVWIGLFWYTMMEYRRNLVQCVIVTAMVDARSRVKFSQSYLMSCMWFGMGPDEAEAVLGKLPLIDLRLSANCAAFWRLHEYSNLDRSNERMCIAVLLEIVIIWLLLKFIVTSLTLMSYGELPAVLIVTLFDLVVFGIMILIALKSALDMNNLMAVAKQVFVEAKYEVSMDMGKNAQEVRMESARGNKPSLADAEVSEAKYQDLVLARRLLTEYLDLCNEYDMRDTILFGMEVTPGKIVSSAGTVAMAVWTLIQSAAKKGTVNVPAALEEKVKHEAEAQGHQIQAAAAVGQLALYSAGKTVQFLAKKLL